MRARLAGILAVALLVAGCAGSGASSADAPRVRCVDEPGRSESYRPDRPLFFLFCVQSP